MILFCDTSALVKLYIAEAGSQELKARVQEAEAVAVCRIAWAEAFAALSRRAREVPEDALPIEQAKAALAADWPHFAVAHILRLLRHALEQGSQAAGDAVCIASVCCARHGLEHETGSRKEI